MSDRLALCATIAIGITFGLAVGGPIAYVLLDHLLWAVQSRKWKEIDRKAVHKANAMRDREDRDLCARCGHPKAKHENEPIGCQVELHASNDAIDCECERYLARPR